MKILVVGLGNIAYRHIKNIKKVFPAATIAVWRHQEREENLQEIAPLIEKIFFTKEDVLHWKPEAALITNPAAFHLKSAYPLALQGIHLFIEKPISHSLEGVEEFVMLCKKNQVTLCVGYNFRFYPPFHLLQSFLKEGKIGQLLSLRAEVGQFLPDWRPYKDYRNTVSAKSELGGGVLLELSHEIDFLLRFGGQVNAVTALIKHISKLEIDVEDTADLLFHFSSGATGILHLDMVDHANTRHMRIVGTDGTITWDGLTHEIRWYSAMTKKWAVYPSPPEWETNQMYVDEIKNFLESISMQTTRINDVNQDCEVLQLINAAKQSSDTGHTIPIVSRRFS